MKRPLALLLFLCLTILGLHAQTDSLSKYQLLWEITSPKTKLPSYLFGTMHVTDGRAFQMPDSVLLEGTVALVRQVGTEQSVLGYMTEPGQWAGGFAAWDPFGVYFATGRAENPGRMLRLGGSELDDVISIAGTLQATEVLGREGNDSLTGSANCTTWPGFSNFCTADQSTAALRPQAKAALLAGTATALSSMARNMAASPSGIQPRCQA